MTKEEIKAYNAVYRAVPAHKAAKAVWEAAYRAANPEKIKARDAAYRAANPEKVKAASAAWNAVNKERTSVRHHHYWIFKSKDPKRHSYKGMSFFDGWNPKKGGSYQAGADWIIANLGKKPKGCSLHIIHHDMGFVPGNLEWTYPKKQNNQQMFKIISQQRHEIGALKKQILELEQALKGDIYNVAVA
jgi:allantoicase